MLEQEANLLRFTMRPRLIAEGARDGVWLVFFSHRFQEARCHRLI